MVTTVDECFKVHITSCKYERIKVSMESLKQPINVATTSLLSDKIKKSNNSWNLLLPLHLHLYM